MGPRRDGQCSVAMGRLLTITAAALASALVLQTDAQAQEGGGAGSELKEARQLTKRAVDLWRQGQYDAAMPFAERALRINGKALGPDHPLVAASLNNLAKVYEAKGYYARAEPLFERALRIKEKALGTEHPDVANSLGNLAGLHEATGDYTRAKPLYERALRIREKALGPENPDVATSLNNLAGLYEATGDYALAAPLYVRALSIFEKTLGSAHHDVAVCLNNLAGLYYRKGDYTRAEPLLERALRILEKVLGPDHADVATVLNSLAEIYEGKGDYARAKPLFERALRILEEAQGPQPSNVAKCLGNLAGLYYDVQDYARAEPLYERALRILEKVLGPDHPDIAQSANNLALLHYTQGDYARAEPLYKRALRIREKALGPEHPDVATSLSNLAALYWTKRDYSRAVETKRRADDVRESNLAAILTTGAEEQKQAYLATLFGETNGTVSLHVRSAPTLPDAARLALTAILRRKGRALEAMRDLFRVLRQHADSEDLARIDELARVRAELATRTLRGPAKGEDVQAHLRRLAELREAGRQIEEALASRYAALGLKQAAVTMEAVQAALPSDTALVEYFVFEPFDARAKRESQWGKPHYVAYVLRPKGEPGWVDLGEAERINWLAHAVRTNYAAGDLSAASRPARDLEKLVMAPVRKLLGATTNVFLSPDGELNLVPFGALTNEKGEFLVERYRFTYLSSGRDMLRLALRSDAREGATIVAAPDYGNANQKPAATEKNSERGQRSVDMESIKFSPLPGSLIEARRLARTLGDVRVLTGADATEGALKSMRAPRILHLATHGFFLADLPAPSPGESQRGISHIESLGEVPRPRMALPENPLLRSGLALAGANRRASGQDDGILTAMEAMSLDLAGTQLVVLSACETGMGDVRTGDGVYGLRRALVLAGAETQIMTLWRIDDEVTHRLMAEYYEKIGKGMGRSDAMRDATLKMLLNPKTANPKYWASFIVSGDPSPLRTKPETADTEGPRGVLHTTAPVPDPTGPPAGLSPARSAASIAAPEVRNVCAHSCERAGRPQP